MSGKFAISWIYGEFQIARMHKGAPVEQWTAPFEVKDLVCLNEALIGASEHLDLSKGGEVAITYEDVLHTHEFLEVPQMSNKDLNKLLERKVEQTKPFEEKAAWCFHEAKHSDETEGILLHIMPQRIVDATVRMCQEFYLTPRRMVPLTEIVSEVVVDYPIEKTNLIIVTALFKHRTEILISLGDGEVLFVRELPYSGNEENQDRLVIDINRTIRYAKQRFSKPVQETWLIGERTALLCEIIEDQIESNLNYDPKGLHPYYWVTQVANLNGQLSTNFIPLLARKEINRTLVYRMAIWIFIITLSVTFFTTLSVEYALAKQAVNRNHINTDKIELENKINRIKTLIKKEESEKKRLKMLQANSKNLPALFVNHMGDILPDGLILSNLEVKSINTKWQVTLKGTSHLQLEQLVDTLQLFESKLSAPPWNIHVKKSWKSSWYKQLESGAASNNTLIGFELIGWMK